MITTRASIGDTVLSPFTSLGVTGFVQLGTLLFRTEPVALPVVTSPAVGCESETVNCLVGSAYSVPGTVTEIVWLVTPGAKVNVPLVAW